MSTTTPTTGADGRRRWPVVLAVAVAVVAIVVVVWLLVVRALLGDDAGSTVDPSAEPSPTATESTEPSVAPSEPEPTETDSAAPSAAPTGTGEELVLWFVGEHEDTRNNPALYPEPTDVEAATGADPVQAAVDALLSTLPADPDYGNAYWDAASEDAGRTPATATVTAGTAGTTVDLSADAFSVGVGSEFAALGVQQLVSTVLSNGGTAPVTITVDGASGAEVWGVLALEASYDADESSWSNASITSVREGDTVSSPVTLSGVGFGFEGELDVQVVDEATGDVVQETFVMVEEGMNVTEDGEPIRSGYETSLDLGPGTYRLVVADSDESGGESGFTFVAYDDKVVTVE
jgi:hypothetical protein